MIEKGQRHAPRNSDPKSVTTIVINKHLNFL